VRRPQRITRAGVHGDAGVGTSRIAAEGHGSRPVRKGQPVGPGVDRYGRAYGNVGGWFFFFFFFVFFFFFFFIFRTTIGTSYGWLSVPDQAVRRAGPRLPRNGEPGRRDRGNGAPGS